MYCSAPSKDISKTTIRNTDIKPSSITKKTPVAHQPVHELLETEHDYVENLRILVEVIIVSIVDFHLISHMHCRSFITLLIYLNDIRFSCGD
jgi:hypothetical protein